MNVPSQLEAVTVYASGAVCTRRAKLAPSPERQLRITGLPLSLRPTSLRARVVTGGAELRVLDVRAGFEVQLAEEVDVPAEQKALESAEAQLLRLESALARLTRETQEIAALRPSFPVRKKGDPPRPAPVEAMIQLADFVDQQLELRNARRRELEQKVEDARDEMHLRKRRLAEASSSKRTERARLSRSAVVTLSCAPKQEVELAVEYQVPGARWVPNYELRLDQAMSGGALKMRASVAQNTGEDWDRVTLALSTAQLDRRTDLPQLRSLRIGRSQPAAPRSGWREPPPGLDDLFQGFDEAMPRGPASGSMAGAGPGAPPPALAAFAPRAMMRAAAPKSAGAFGAGAGLGGALSSSRSDEASSVRAPMEALASLDEGDDLRDDEGSGVTAVGRIEAEADAIVPDEALLDYDRLTMPRAHDSSVARGRLHPASGWEFAFVSTVWVQVDVVTAILARAQHAAFQVDTLAMPHHAQSVRASAAAFDYRYECESRVDVPSNGKWSLVPVMVAQVGLTPGYSCVPAVEPKVYRVLKVANRSPHALLQGPVDVSVGDEFLMTTQFPTVAPKGEEARLGLGVEEAVKVARKTQFKETSGGLLGGSTMLPHEIEIEVNNRLPYPASIEIRERVPVSQDTDVKIEELQVRPPWEKDEKLRDGVQTDGARRWQVSVAAGEKATVTAQFSIKIPADKMLVGGNRRV